MEGAPVGDTDGGMEGINDFDGSKDGKEEGTDDGSKLGESLGIPEGPADGLDVNRKGSCSNIKATAVLS
jgi:hypothetical protein